MSSGRCASMAGEEVSLSEVDSTSVTSSESGQRCIQNKWCWFGSLVLIGMLVVSVVSLLWILLRMQGSTPMPAHYCEEAMNPAFELPEAGAPLAIFKAWAANLVGQLSLDEKHSLLKGTGWWGMQQMPGYYVGNILGVPRLGIPPINMHDAAQGFRPTDERMVGQVTSWPCALAVAATWDANATWHWARALGEEHLAKGANMILGPSVNVHRVAANGRNGEYISGEDPTLGAVLAAAYVQGVQEGAGVAAVVKHFALNQQETSRTQSNSIADERTRWEVYYPPFQAAVSVGVAAVMCSYNYVNGQQACENSQLLTEDLKGRMNFSGFVMSDWWALQSGRGPSAGTDMDMPGSDSYFTPVALDSMPSSYLDGMVSRVLIGMARSGAWRSRQTVRICRAGCDCDGLLYGAIATTPDHVALARQLATEAVVLLKNGPRAPDSKTTFFLNTTTRSSVLPLRSGQRLAVLGRACSAKPDVKALLADWRNADYYVLGGSGRVLSPNAVSVLEGLRGRGLHLSTSESDSLTAAAAALDGADVALMCGGATSSESFDRNTLQLDNEQFLLAALRLASSVDVPAIIVALTPGAIVTPWRHGAAAALSVFLSGQETGNAVADILTGMANPSGKLPVTFPEREEDALWPCGSSPFPSPFASSECGYAERLGGGWHFYSGKPVAFPFGHGLSYTEFEYSVAQDWSAQSGSSLASTLSVRVRNGGRVAGAEVVQLYVRFPRESGEPDLVLRGFHKTQVLLPGQDVQVKFQLSSSDLSVWDVEMHAWRQQKGRFETFVGASSRDLRLCGAFDGATVQPMQAC